MRLVISEAIWKFSLCTQTGDVIVSVVDHILMTSSQDRDVISAVVDVYAMVLESMY